MDAYVSKPFNAENLARTIELVTSKTFGKNSLAPPAAQGPVSARSRAG
jgi:hypothetical protein